MTTLKKNELKKKDFLKIRSHKNGEILAVVVVPELRIGVEADDYENKGIYVPNKINKPTNELKRLYNMTGTLCWDGAPIVSGTVVGGGGGGGAPTNASYLVLGTDGTLTDERVFTAGAGIDVIDAGAGSTYTVSVNPAYTGSLTKLSGGGSYIEAGDNVTVTTGSSGQITIASTGGGGSTYEIWDAHAPPAIAHDLDDEFTGSSIHSNWAEWDPGSISMTTTVLNQRAIVESPIIAGDKLAGIYKYAPTASAGDYEYAVWTRLGGSSQDASNYPGVFIFAAVDIKNNPTTSRIHIMNRINESNVMKATSALFNNYSGFGGNRGSLTYGGTNFFARIRVSYESSSGNSTIGRDFSDDGSSWQQVSTDTYNEEFTHVGLGVNNVGGSSALQGKYDFFRCATTSSFWNEPSGSLITRTYA